MSIRTSTYLVLAFLFSLASPAVALPVDWAGTITIVLEDDGTSVELTGNGVGDGFSGSFVVGDTCGAGCSTTVEADETDYEFNLGALFGASLSDGVDTITSTNAAVNIQNDHALDADEADLASVLTGMTVSPGTRVDVYTLAATSDDAIFDMEDELFDGGVVEVVLASFDTSLFSDTSYQPVPPDLADVDFAFFFVSDAAAGTVTYEVIGSVDAIGVPEPAGAVLLAAAAGLGLCLGRR